MQFRGSFVAIITPLDRKGRLDTVCLERLVEWHIQEGTDGLVCCGTTGEGVCLSDAEKKRIAEICIRVAKGRIPIIVSTGMPDTRGTVRLTAMAAKLGASGALVVTPYYNRPSQPGCIAHFREVSKVGLPLIVYHNPGRAVIRLAVETVRTLSEIPHIVALKESSGDLGFVRQVRSFLPLLAGDDDCTYEILREGGVGAIGVVPNLIPRGWKAMISFAREKRWKEAELLVSRYLPLIQSLFLETNPQGIKFALSCVGRCSPQLRLPLLVPPLKIRRAIQKEMLRLSLPHLSPSQIQSIS